MGNASRRCLVAWGHQSGPNEVSLRVYFCDIADRQVIYSWSSNEWLAATLLLGCGSRSCFFAIGKLVETYDQECYQGVERVRVGPTVSCGRRLQAGQRLEVSAEDVKQNWTATNNLPKVKNSVTLNIPLNYALLQLSVVFCLSDRDCAKKEQRRKPGCVPVFYL